MIIVPNTYLVQNHNKSHLESLLLKKLHELLLVLLMVPNNNLLKGFIPHYSEPQAKCITLPQMENDCQKKIVVCT